ncbi:MAG: carbohydrate ABC transporter permease, partial [Angelakisella sp.]
MAKTKKMREPLNLRKELALSPGYILVGLWVIFTFMLIAWIFIASLSTTREIFTGKIFEFESGMNWKNYVKAWKTNKVSVYFMNSVLYTLVSCTMVVCVAAPAAYVLSRFRFKGNTFLQNMFVTALGIPAIMIIMPLFSITSALQINN